MDDAIFFASEDGWVYALDTSSQEFRQFFYVGAKVRTPLDYEDETGILYVHDYDGDRFLRAVDLESAVELWSVIPGK